MWDFKQNGLIHCLENAKDSGLLLLQFFYSSLYKTMLQLKCGEKHFV